MDFPKESEQVSTMMESSITPEPPKISIPAEPHEVAKGSTNPPIPHESSNVFPNDTTDEELYATYDYNNNLPKHHQI